MWFFVPRIASPQNLGNILSNMWPLLAVAIGQTFVLIIAGIDLSQTAIISLTSVIGALIMTSGVEPLVWRKAPVWHIMLWEEGGLLVGSPLAVPVAILVMLAIGVLIGWLNGMAVAKLKMPPFMVTLIAMMFFGALAIWLVKSENLIGLPEAYIIIGQGQIFFIPYTLFIVGALAVVAHIILSRTVYGRWFYAVGTNLKTAMISGVPTERVIILAFVFSGFCAAFSSVLFSARLAGGRPTLGGTGLLLDIIGATVIGGTSLYGGKGKVIWTVFGVLFFVLLNNSLNLLNLSFFTVLIVKGGFILLAAFFDATRTRLLKRQ